MANSWLFFATRALAWGLCLSAAVSGQSPTALVARLSAEVDGDLGEWLGFGAKVRLGEEAQVVAGKSSWNGPADFSADLLLAADTNHLFLAGQVRDDQLPNEQTDAAGNATRLEFYLGSDAESLRPEDVRLHLMPWNRLRPWAWLDATNTDGRKSGAQLAGVKVAWKRLDESSYQFEVAIPFHHLPGLAPGSKRMGLGVVLRDQDGEETQATALSWTGDEPEATKHLGQLVLPAPGPLVSLRSGAPLLSEELLADLPYLLVPLVLVVALVLALRAWSRMRNRSRWLQPILFGSGVLLLVAGLVLPAMLGDQRIATQREKLDTALDGVQGALAKLEQGTLASYRGASRDRAFVDLLSGKAIARQRYTTYRTLAELAPDQFGPGVQMFDELPVRPYLLPLRAGRSESFQFDPALHSSRLFLVIGRPYPLYLSGISNGAPVKVRLSLDFGAGEPETREMDLDEPFLDGAPFGVEAEQACLLPVELKGDLRSLSVAVDRSTDLTLVGISLQGDRPGAMEPLLLGAPTLGGVLTDLRGAYPRSAGIELAPGATARVALPKVSEPFHKLWFVYRATYPEVPSAVPGVPVAEIVLHFAGGASPRTITLEHQVSMFYELAVHNTRDDPPEGSPAAIALSWLDDQQEKHVNFVYPVLDLPTGSELTAIEWRNLSGYRMRFRSVVFGRERVAAPQDPVDSPVLREGQERRLRADVLEQVSGTSLLLYRGGRLSDATLPAEQRQDFLQLPRQVRDAALTVKEDLLKGGARRVTLFAPLQGDGWDGAVLGIAATDPGWQASRQFDARIGLVLCLLGTPLLLVMLSELLARATNLRFRLMAVFSLAALAPLGVLSFVLAQVLEDGHRNDVQEKLLATVRNSTQQLEGEKEKVRSSARQWLQGLMQLAVGRLEKVAPDQFAKAVPGVRSELQKLLLGQLPPEWRGGFLRLDWQPALGEQLLEPVSLVVGERRMANLETPARLEPGLFFQWGTMLLGARAEDQFRGGVISLTAARPLDGDLLGALAPGQALLLTDTRGYPLAASSSHPDAQWLSAHAMDPPVMLARERVLATSIENRSPVVERLAGDAEGYVFGSDVLRDLQDTPRGLLVLAEPDQRASLDLATGRMPVRAFFLLVAGLLVVLAVFLSLVVSGRISRPIERLEAGTLALAMGKLDTRVEVEDGGQIGSLTRRFNEMAADLEGRLQDLQALNRTMRELSAQDDENQIVELLARFCAAHTAADAVRVAALDHQALGLVVHGGGQPHSVSMAQAPTLLAGFHGVFAQSARLQELGPIWQSVLPEARSLLGLPIAFAGRVRGVVLLGFACAEPLEVDLELLGTVVSQASIALERSQLHRLAVQDPVTGCFTPEYFRRRVVDEVSLAQQLRQSLVMAAVELGDGEQRPRGLRRLAAILQREAPPAAVISHAGAGRFEILFPNARRDAAEGMLRLALAAWQELVSKLPENEVEAQPPRTVVVQFPDEAPSTEFLYDAVRARLEALETPFASAMESDASLARAGVTAISPAMREVYNTLRRVAPSDLPILLEGETGVGKEVLTNLVHRWSRRAGGPLVKVHCAALSETLLASELFGHERGAFTGADRRKIGRFEQADGGTLFLDEVGDIPLDVQVKLLRVLQEREIDRVGGTEPVRVDVRVIAATNRDIAKMVAAGTFREDLYYRLQGMVVKVPPLRERKLEVAGLVEHFRRELVEAGQSNVRALSPEAMDELYRRDWPGNVRELRNAILRAMVFAQGAVVSRRDLLAALDGAVGREALPAAPEPAAPEPAAPGPAGTGEPQQQPATPVPSRPALQGRLLAIFDLVAATGDTPTQRVVDQLGVPQRTVLRDLKSLVETGHLDRVGTRRGAFYRIRQA